MNRGQPAAAREFRGEETQAYAWCRDYARAHSENFAVVSWLLPSKLRPHFFALYAFCRATDDLGDEAEGDRLQLLDTWEQKLHACYGGQRDAPLFKALGRTIDTYSVPEDLFLRLIEANRMDQRLVRFETYNDLRHYCEHSAAPVGRMVLFVLGYADERQQRLTDAICLGLQLANFWQDVSVDLTKDRIYIPFEDLRRFGCSEDQLKQGVVNESFRNLIQFEVERARSLFTAGRGLEDLIDRRARLDVRLFREGGEAVLDAIERARYNVLSRRPRVGRTRRAWTLVVNGVLIGLLRQ